MTNSAKSRVLRNARLFSSNADYSNDIEYVFGNNYLTTYLNKGPYQVKSLVPRLPWDPPSPSIAQERSDTYLIGNNDHVYSYTYLQYRYKMFDLYLDIYIDSLKFIFDLDPLHEPVRRQSNEEFTRVGRPKCRTRRVPRTRCDRNANRSVWLIGQK